MIKNMGTLFSLLQAVPPGTPVLVTLGDGKSHDISIDGGIDGSTHKVTFSQGYGQPFTYDAAKMLGECRFYRPYSALALSYLGREFEIESMTFDGEVLLLNAKVDQEPQQSEQRLAEIVELVGKYGMIDGGHHKQWLLDQVLRLALAGDYEEHIRDYNGDPAYDAWDTGIAP